MSGNSSYGQTDDRAKSTYAVLPWRVGCFVPHLRMEWWLWRQQTGERASFQVWSARREREDLEREQGQSGGIGMKAMQDAEAARRRG